MPRTVEQIEADIEAVVKANPNWASDACDKVLIAQFVAEKNQLTQSQGGNLSPRLLYSCFILASPDLSNVSGTCSIVSKTLVLSAYHCVACDPRTPTKAHVKNWIICSSVNRKEILNKNKKRETILSCETVSVDSNKNPVIENAPIPVTVYRYNIQFDWVLLQRTDGKEFSSPGILKVCPLNAIFQCVEEQLKVYHAPIEQFTNGVVDAVAVVPKDSRFGMRSEHNLYLEGVLFGGSSGGISIVASQNPQTRGLLLSMHQESFSAAMTTEEVKESAEDLEINGNDALEVLTTAVNSVANPFNSFSHGLLVGTQKKLMEFIEADN